MAPESTRVLDWGLLQPLINDPEVIEILVEGFGKPSIFRKTRTQVRGSQPFTLWIGADFADEAAFTAYIEALFAPDPIDAAHVTARRLLPDGTLISAMLPPVARDGPMLMIRKPAPADYAHPYTTITGAVSSMGMATGERLIEFLAACVEARLTICITGVERAARSTWLQTICALIHPDERVIVLENSPGLKLTLPHVVYLRPTISEHDERAKQSAPMGTVLGRVWDLRADRIVIDPLSEPLATMDGLMHFSGSYGGGLFTLPASSPRAALSLLEMQFLSAGYDTPDRVARQYVSNAIDLIVHVGKNSAGMFGYPGILEVTEVREVEDERILLTPLFTLTPQGNLAPTGQKPAFLRSLTAYGFALAPDTFGDAPAETQKRRFAAIRSLIPRVRQRLRRKPVFASPAANTITFEYDSIVQRLREHQRASMPKDTIDDDIDDDVFFDDGDDFSFDGSSSRFDKVDDAPKAAPAEQPPPEPKPSPEEVAAARALRDRLAAHLYFAADSDERYVPWLMERRRADLEPAFDEELDKIIAAGAQPLTPEQRTLLFDTVFAEAFGYGPLHTLLNDDSITEILVNAPDCIYVEQRGMLKQVDTAFDDAQHANRIIDRMVSPLGTRIDAENPMVTARSADGRSIFSAMLPPISRFPIAAIRKYSMRPLTISDLIRFGAMSNETAEFLRGLTIAGANLLISGNAGSGKQTLMQTLTEYIPNDLRIITAEGRAELQLYSEHVLTLESRAPNVAGKGMISVPDLIDAAIQHRAHWLILGEITMEDAFAYVQAATIADLTTWTLITGYSPSDAIGRLESLILMRSPLPAALIRSRVASAVNFVIQQDRLRDGTRRIMAVSEVQGVENGQIKLVDILRFEEVAVENGKIIGRIRPTGVIPNFYRELFNMGIEISPETFGVDEARLRAFIGDEQYRLKEEERQRSSAQKEAREREAKREAKRRADEKRRQEKQRKQQAKQTAKTPKSSPNRPSRPGGGGPRFTSDDDLDSGFDDDTDFGSDDLDSFSDLSGFDDEDSFG